MPVYGPNPDIPSNRSWEFSLITVHPTKKTDYTPRSDALLCINKFPHLILEIISGGGQSDHYRMLLQAACLARLGNDYEKPKKSSTRPFITSAIYIDADLCAHWYFMYQPLPSHRAVRLISQEAVHYLRLGRLIMSWRPLNLQIRRRCSPLCFGSTTLPRWPKTTMIL